MGIIDSGNGCPLISFGVLLEGPMTSVMSLPRLSDNATTVKVDT